MKGSLRVAQFMARQQRFRVDSFVPFAVITYLQITSRKSTSVLRTKRAANVYERGSPSQK